MRKGDGSHDASRNNKEVSMDSTNYTHFAFNDNEEDSVVCKDLLLFPLTPHSRHEKRTKLPIYRI